MKLQFFCLAGLMAFAFSAIGQSSAPENWYNLDQGNDNVSGVSTERMYSELLKDRASQTVIVAVIDSGVDPDHEDLEAVMWINEDEIPDNGIDDDNNGYVDDINGWNFIGGKNGKSVKADALEITRLTAHYKKKFENKDVTQLSKKEKKEYARYQELKKIIEDKRTDLLEKGAGYIVFSENLSKIKEMVKGEVTADAISKLDLKDEDLKRVAERLSTIMTKEGITFDEISEEINGASEYFSSQLDYLYNVDFDPRAEIVGDDYSNSYEKGYGNNDVKGPDASHGTHVAGIIAAVRNNDVGINGVADNVRIMSVRAVPDGDERDKDVANAIIYAVDNGASIINMSFGKGYAWDKEAVDKAVKYAQKKDVLLVHAAGNDATLTDIGDHFPNDKYAKKGWFRKKAAKNWLEVGALSWKGGEDAVASFSNYGKENVDLFAPGHQIMSTTPDQGYAAFSGTSMASPVTAGVAAVLRSYFPTLSAGQVKDILMSTTVKQNQQVKKPGSDETVSFAELCQTGGVVNAFKAVKLAMVTKGEKKIKKKDKSDKVARP